MCHRYLGDSRLYFFLLKIDQDLATRCREAQCCFCGGPIHCANYVRETRGHLVSLPPGFSKRFSFCCAKDSCRRRNTPPSVRFLGRKVYLAVTVLLVTAMRQGPTPPSEKKLREILEIDRKTLKAWQKWWQEIFPRSEFWAQARRRLHPDVPSPSLLPLSILENFGALGSLECLLRCLRFLSPVSTPLKISEHASLWPC